MQALLNFFESFVVHPLELLLGQFFVLLLELALLLLDTVLHLFHASGYHIAFVPRGSHFQDTFVVPHDNPSELIKFHDNRAPAEQFLLRCGTSELRVI